MNYSWVRYALFYCGYIFISYFPDLCGLFVHNCQDDFTYNGADNGAAVMPAIVQVLKHDTTKRKPCSYFLLCIACIPESDISEPIKCHYNDVIMSVMASQITSLTIIYSTVYSGEDQRKHQSSASLAFMRGIHRWPVNSPHKGPVTRKMFPFDDVIMAMCVITYSAAMEVIMHRWHSQCTSRSTSSRGSSDVSLG